MIIKRERWTIMSANRTKIWCIAKGTQCFFQPISDLDRSIIRTYRTEKDARKANLDFEDDYEFVKIVETFELPD